MLLRTVMDVAFESTTLSVVGVDDALPRLPQLLGAPAQLDDLVGQLGAQLQAVHDRTGLRGQCREESLLDRRQGLALGLLQSQYAQRFACQPDRFLATAVDLP